MSRELVKNASIYVIMSFFTQGLMVLFWIILGRWLTPVEIGIYALALFVIDFFSAVAIVGLDSAITRFYYSEHPHKAVLSSAVAMLGGASAVAVLLFLAVAQFIPRIIPGLGTILEDHSGLFLGLIVLNTLVNCLLVHYTALKKSTHYATLNLLKIAFWFTTAILLVQRGFSVIGVLYGLLTALIVAAILFYIRERALIALLERPLSLIQPLFSYGFPLMLYSVVGVIAAYTGRIVLDRYTNLVTLGIYSFFLALTLQVNGLWGSINRAWTPEIFSRFLHDRERTTQWITTTAFLFSGIYLIGFALLIIVGESFLWRLVFKEVYFAERRLFYILLLGPLFTGIYTAVYPLFYYENHTKRILTISVLLSTANILFTIFFVRLFELKGAVVSYVLMSILTTITYLFVFKKVAQIPRRVISWSILLSCMVMGGLVIRWQSL